MHIFNRTNTPLTTDYSPHHLLAAPLDLVECLDTVETFLSPCTGHWLPATSTIACK